MKYLLDTHIFLWWVLENSKLNKQTQELISDLDNELYLSTASTWEMVIKSNVGKLSLPNLPEEFIRNQLVLNDIKILDIRLEHTLALSELPMIHKDPFDRILIAQARWEKLILITDDKLIRSYDVYVAGQNNKNRR